MAIWPIQVKPGSINNDLSNCAKVEVSVTPMPAGQLRLTAQSTCLARSLLSIEYAGFHLLAPFDANGKLDYVVDCFAGDKVPLELVFPNGEREVKHIEIRDLDQTTKVAIIWRGEVNLDLHAFEYAAGAGELGHVWQGAASTMTDAAARAWGDRRGHGFMSALSSGAVAGDQVEVYTFLHSKDQRNGVIKMALDYQSRYTTPPNAKSCGSGELSRLEYQVFVLARGRLTTASGVFIAASCGENVDVAARFNTKAVPSLFIR